MRAWLRGVHGGQNLTWSDRAFPVEPVGPVVGTKWCCLAVREEGVVLEIRALDGRLAHTDWPDLADEVTAVFRRLNTADDL